MTILGTGHHHPDDLRRLADTILSAHLPAGPALNWSWRAMPRVNEHRRCLQCATSWPCQQVQWARQTKNCELPSWSL